MRSISITLLLLFIFLFSNATKTIHVFVALCDNVNQGIVKVPDKIGNGQDPANNLYWGCAYGVKTFFKNSKDWQLIKTIKNPSAEILQRVLFKHQTDDAYLLADAYDGAEIKRCTLDMLNSCAGNFNCTIILDSMTLGFGGNADLIAYTGHNGLMDFQLNELPKKHNNKKRDVIILACFSKSYFTQALRSTGANPLVWSTHLMSPEAYTLKASIDGWLLNAHGESIRTRAAKAYNLYQKCGEKAARNLLVNGW